MFKSDGRLRETNLDPVQDSVFRERRQIRMPESVQDSLRVANLAPQLLADYHRTDCLSTRILSRGTGSASGIPDGRLLSDLIRCFAGLALEPPERSANFRPYPKGSRTAPGSSHAWSAHPGNDFRAAQDRTTSPQPIT